METSVKIGFVLFCFLCSELALKGLDGVRHGLFRSTVTFFFRLSGNRFSELVC